jgi:diguanylate cyclase (GGDEF)-like protein
MGGAMLTVFDLPTVAVFGALAMLYVWRVHRQEPAMPYWTAGFVLLALGVALVLQREHLPLPMSIAVGNPLIILGFALMVAGTAVFVGQPIQWFWLAAIVLINLGVQIYWGLLAPWLALRVLVFVLANTLICVLMIIELLRAARGSAQGTTFRLLALINGIFVLTSLTHFSNVLNAGAFPLFGGGLTEALWLAAGQAVVFFNPFGFLLMTSQRLQLRLDQLANKDDLTGVLNRRAFLAQAQNTLIKGAEDAPAGILALDIDRFKHLNDRYGHAAGDAALRHFAQTVQQLLRSSDLFARVGGEEFWILLPDTDLHGATQLAERIRAAVQQNPAQLGGHRLDFTVSIGISPARGKEVSSAASLADEALYRAKALGRNRVVLASEEAGEATAAAPEPAAKPPGTEAG